MTDPIGVVVAMHEELRHLLADAPPHAEKRDGVWRDLYLEIGGLSVIAVRCGIGLTNAAAATERLINAHRPRAVLNFGCTGAHRRDIVPGDVVIGTRVVHQGAFVVLPSGEERRLGLGYELEGDPLDGAALPTDPALVALAQAAAEGFRPSPWPESLPWPTGMARRAPVVHVGPVASGDIWTQSIDRLDRIHAHHASLCEDMEAAAVAQICALHRVPYLTIKDISNNEYYRPTDVGAFAEEHGAEIGRGSAKLTYRTIALMAAKA